MSLWQIAQAAIFTLISPGPGSAISTSSIASGWPKARQTAAFMTPPDASCGARWQTAGEKRRRNRVRKHASPAGQSRRFQSVLKGADSVKEPEGGAAHALRELVAEGRAARTSEQLRALPSTGRLLEAGQSGGPSPSRLSRGPGGILLRLELLGDQRMRVLGRGAGAPVGAGQDLEEMSVGVFEIGAAAVVPVVDLIAPPLVGIGPIGQAALLDAGEDLVELGLAHQERIMLRLDLPAGIDEIQGQFVADRDQGKGTEEDRRREAEDLAQEQGRGLPVAGRHDRMIELGCHWLKTREGAAGFRAIRAPGPAIGQAKPPFRRTRSSRSHAAASGRRVRRGRGAGSRQPRRTGWPRADACRSRSAAPSSRRGAPPIRSGAAGPGPRPASAPRASSTSA